MALNYTLTMIKPGAVLHNHIGPILGMINEHGFIIRAMKLTRLRKPKAELFYEIHKDKPFFDELIEFMCSGPIVAAILEKENAVKEFRDLIGSTNPEMAESGTIRYLFAESLSHNAIHGSDSDENAIRESAFFFPETERFMYDYVPFKAHR